MKKIALQQMGLVPMEMAEMQSITGGGKFSRWFKRFGIAGIINEIINNWDDIKRGLHDGWNFDKEIHK